MEFIFEFIFEFMFESFKFIFYPIGWSICRIITLGNYPQGGISGRESDSKLNDMFISFLGVMAILAVAYFIF